MHYADVERSKEQKAGAKKNLTGIPLQMKMEFERRSGLSFDDVRVHYGSDRPARFGALAYTQGNQVYIGPGQEKHLSHELSHVVQQKMNLVRPNGMVNGEPLNDDAALERAADRAEFPGRSTNANIASTQGGTVQRTDWKLGAKGWYPFSDVQTRGRHDLPPLNDRQGKPQKGSFFDDIRGELYPPNSPIYLKRLLRRRNERDRAGIYDNAVTRLSRRKPRKAIRVPTPADPKGKISKMYMLFGQLMVSGAGLGERRPPGTHRPVRKGLPAYADILDRTSYPPNAFSSAAEFLIQRPNSKMPSAPSELTAEQSARVAALTVIQGSEEKRVPTGGSLPYAFLMAAERYGPQAAIGQYPFAPKGGTKNTRELVEGEKEFTEEQAQMFLQYIPSSPRLMGMVDEDSEDI